MGNRLSSECLNLSVGRLDENTHYVPQRELACATGIVSTRGIWVLQKYGNLPAKVILFFSEGEGVVEQADYELPILTPGIEGWQLQATFDDTLFLRHSETREGYVLRHPNASASALNKVEMPVGPRTLLLGRQDLLRIDASNGNRFYQRFDEAGVLTQEIPVALQAGCTTYQDRVVFREPLLFFGSSLPYHVCWADTSVSSGLAEAILTPLHSDYLETLEHQSEGTDLIPSPSGEVVAVARAKTTDGYYDDLSRLLTFDGTLPLNDEFLARDLGLFSGLYERWRPGLQDFLIDNSMGLWTTQSGSIQRPAVSNAFAVTTGAFLGDRFYAGVLGGELYFDLSDGSWHNDSAVSALNSPWSEPHSFFSPTPAGWLLSHGGYSFGCNESLWVGGELVIAYVGGAMCNPRGDLQGHSSGVVWKLEHPEGFWSSQSPETLNNIQLSRFAPTASEGSEFVVETIDFSPLSPIRLLKVEERSAWLYFYATETSSPFYQEVIISASGDLALGPRHNLNTEVDPQSEWTWHRNVIPTPEGFADIQVSRFANGETDQTLRVRKVVDAQLRTIYEERLPADTPFYSTLPSAQGDSGLWFTSYNQARDKHILSYRHLMPDGSISPGSSVELEALRDIEHRTHPGVLFGIYPVPNKDEALVLSEDGVYHLRGYCAE